MTTRKLYALIDWHEPKGILYNLRKMPCVPQWRVRIYNEAEWEARGFTASYLEFYLFPFLATEGMLSDEEAVWKEFDAWAEVQRHYDWQSQAPTHDTTAGGGGTHPILPAGAPCGPKTP